MLGERRLIAMKMNRNSSTKADIVTVKRWNHIANLNLYIAIIYFCSISRIWIRINCPDPDPSSCPDPNLCTVVSRSTEKRRHEQEKTLPRKTIVCLKGLVRFPIFQLGRLFNIWKNSSAFFQMYCYQYFCRNINVTFVLIKC